ncbi:hypothetical protein NGF19_13965 [Streptomyces sp. RY43-2]|uniref:Uncharacterized protein n=1 Tax=Streptomyces macrolidinus TaxID=2952607 RepID=A0ABT0ZE71_9ACTN|nr:hypothetical protein [Streptomyces macrolidinus]MCN9241884.1 hypothetical protein [Streptomyces macrolidinus]
MRTLPKTARRCSMLPPAPLGIVPYIAGYSREEVVTPQLIKAPFRGRLGFEDETDHDRDSFGVPWVRPTILPKARRGSPRLKTIHPYRQRRCMLDLLCQICRRPTSPDYEGPYLFLAKSMGGPITEGETTGSPPVCVPCAAISVQLCPAIRGQFTAAWVQHAPFWGVVGNVYDPKTLQVRAVMANVRRESPLAAWTVASRMVVELQGVRPANLAEEWAALGRDRLEAEFARVVELAS